VSCDPFNPLNPIPIYDDVTTLEKPTRRLVQDAEIPLDIVAIDHLPSLVPGTLSTDIICYYHVLFFSWLLFAEESSREFADALLPHLSQFGSTPVWKRAADLFEKKCNELVGKQA